MIAVVDKSTALSTADTQLMTRACASQLRYHVGPAWGRIAAPVVSYTDETLIPPGAWPILLIDNADQANALGWHSVSPQGVPYGRVFVNPILQHGGTPLRGRYTVASVLAHEAIEEFLDPGVQMWADDYRTDRASRLYAYEACDPVESDGYDIKLSTAPNGPVTVSNFVTPGWFDSSSRGPYDYLGKLKAPFSMTSGGYVVYRTGSGTQQEFGRKFPAWKKETKEFPASRTFKRMNGVQKTPATA